MNILVEDIKPIMYMKKHKVGEITIIKENGILKKLVIKDLEGHRIELNKLGDKQDIEAIRLLLKDSGNAPDQKFVRDLLKLKNVVEPSKIISGIRDMNISSNFKPKKSVKKSVKKTKKSLKKSVKKTKKSLKKSLKKKY